MLTYIYILIYKYISVQKFKKLSTAIPLTNEHFIAISGIQRLGQIASGFSNLQMIEDGMSSAGNPNLLQLFLPIIQGIRAEESHAGAVAFADVRLTGLFT